MKKRTIIFLFSIALVMTPFFSRAQNVGIGTQSPSGKLHVVGNILAIGTLTQNSDVRLKKNIRPLSNTLSKRSILNGYTCNWKDNNNSDEQIGFLAQEIQKLYPQLVKESDNGTLSVNYSGMIPVLLEAIKELKNEIEKQQKQIDALNNKK